MQLRRKVLWAIVALVPVASGAWAGAAGTVGSAAALLKAVKAGDVPAIRELVKQPNLANAAEPDGTTALHWATDRDNLAAAQLLVYAGADVKAKNRYGVTPLYSAAVNGDAEMIKLLLDTGADANAALPEGETALMTAARTGRVDAVKVLLGHGADVNVKERWKQQTALMWAAHEGNTDTVKLLLDAGAKVGERSVAGWTAFLFAARQGQVGAIKALAAAGADINETLPDGTSALVTAVQGLNYEAAEALLDLGIDPNASAQGWTALHQVVWSRRPQRGQNNPGQKPQGDVSSLELAKKLVEHGADVNARQTKEPNSDMEGRNNLNRYGATPLFLAARACDVPMLRTLLDLGGDPFLGNVDGDSPLMVAAGVGVYSQGESPGEPEESADAVKALLDLGAPVNEVDKNGETVMHGPAWRGSNEAVTLLVNAGAKLDARNHRGWLPLTIANGVYYNARVMMNLHTAKLLRELMEERGLDASDKDANLGGALRADLALDIEDDAQNPSDVARSLLEKEKASAEAIKKLQEDGKQPMTVHRVGIRMMIPLAAGVMVMAALATPAAQRGRGGGGNAGEGVPVATNAIAAHPDAYYGKPITVSAGLEQMLSPTAFTVDQHKAAGAAEVKAVGAPLLVVAPYLSGAVDQKNYILIHGQLAKLDAAQLAKISADYKLELPREISDKYLGQPVLVATSVRNYAFEEIAKKPVPPPTTMELSMDAVMKTIGPASSALQAAVQASKLEDVPAAVAKLQPAFTETEAMWTKMGERPGALWAIEAREDAAAVQQAAASGDGEKAKTSAAALSLLCGTCHAAYREREDDGTFRIKVSSMR